MKPTSLTGLRVLICRPANQAKPLSRGLEAVGAEVVSVPLIVISDPDDGGAALRSAMSGLGVGDWLVLTSPNGAARAAAAITLPDGVKVAAIGPGTAKRASEEGIPIHLVPRQSIAEGLLEEFPTPRQHSGRVVLARAAVARSTLPDGLREAGWDVMDVPAYRTTAVPLTTEQRRSAVSADAVVFTSSSTVERLVDEVGAGAVPPLIASIGPATTDTAVRRGLNVAVQAAEHTIEGVITALCEHIAAVAECTTPQY